MPFPLTVCQRHPRYVVLLALLLLGSFLLLSPSETFTPYRATYAPTAILDHTLPARIAHSEEIYGRTLDRRQAMIKKYGPDPSQVVMCVLLFSRSRCACSVRLCRFPPDREPWPAYTVCEYCPPTFPFYLFAGEAPCLPLCIPSALSRASRDS